MLIKTEYLTTDNFSLIKMLELCYAMQFRVVITPALRAKLITKLARLLAATIDRVDVTFSTL